VNLVLESVTRTLLAQEICVVVGVLGNCGLAFINGSMVCVVIGRGMVEKKCPKQVKKMGCKSKVRVR
jgi:hypothetical protein